MLSSLIYRSEVTAALSQELLTELIEAAKLSNARKQISGLLLYDYPYFFQALEGPKEALKNLYEKLLADPRHKNVVILADEVISDRQYPKLGMHFMDLQQLKLSDTSLDSYRSKNNLQPVNKNIPNKIEKFINQFIERKTNGTPGIENANQSRLISPPVQNKQPGINAIPPNGYSFAFQAVVDCHKKNIAFVEALARGPNGEGAQAYFSSMSHEELEHFNIHSTEDAISLASQLGIKNLSINFNPRTIFQSTHTADKLADLLHKYGLNCNQLIIELTESDCIGNYKLAHEIISRLRANGIQLAIDDFGAGYAGLSLLAEFQPDIIKIDQALTKNIHSSGPKQAIVSAIVNCAESLAISVVAEGVEDQKDFRLITDLGIHQLQGYLLCTPEINNFSEPCW